MYSRFLDWWDDQNTSTKWVLIILTLICGISICVTLVADEPEEVTRKAPLPTPTSATQTNPQIAPLPVTPLTSKQAMQDTFQEQGFEFEPRWEKWQDAGLYRTVGFLNKQAHHPAEATEALMLDEDRVGVYSIGLQAPAEGASHELGMRNVRRLYLLLLILPEWEGSGEWLNDGLYWTRSTGAFATTTQSDIDISLVYTNHHDHGIGMYSLYLKSKDPEQRQARLLY